MWNCANSSIEQLDLRNASLTDLCFFWGYFTIASSQDLGKGFAKLNHKFAMSFLNNKIGQDLIADIKQTIACDNPFIAVSFIKMISSFFKSSRTRSFKRILKPVKNSNIGIRDLQNTSIMAIFIAITRFVFKFAGMKAAFAINEAGKICKMQRVVLFRNVQIPVFMVLVGELFHDNPQVA